MNKRDFEEVDKISDEETTINVPPEAVRKLRNIQADFSMTCPVWPGMAKVVEESGELQQAIGKIIVSRGNTEYFDGRDLVRPLEEELSDTVAAIMYFSEQAGLDMDFMADRTMQKMNKFLHWKETHQ